MSPTRSAEYLTGLVRELCKLSRETEWLELKIDQAEPEDIGEYLSALSNAAAINGKAFAYLAWGVDDSTHEIVGTHFDPAAAKVGNEELESWLLRLLAPKLHFRFFELVCLGKRVVLLEIERASRQPVQFKGQEFIRVGTYKSRNEALASLMRRIGICEERGSGVDKVVHETEVFQLPAPLFEATGESTRVVLFAHQPLSKMDRADRVRACYLHACLRYVNRESLTNTSLRQRFGIAAKNSATASRLIKEALDEGVIVPLEENAAKKLMKYVPWWAAQARPGEGAPA